MGQTGKMRRTGAQTSAITGFDSYNEICTVRTELLETDPLIWREVRVGLRDELRPRCRDNSTARHAGDQNRETEG
jgi:hypothetical protein